MNMNESCLLPKFGILGYFGHIVRDSGSLFTQQTMEGMVEEMGEAEETDTTLLEKRLSQVTPRPNKKHMTKKHGKLLPRRAQKWSPIIRSDSGSHIAGRNERNNTKTCHLVLRHRLNVSRVIRPSKISGPKFEKSNIFHTSKIEISQGFKGFLAQVGLKNSVANHQFLRTIGWRAHQTL